MKKNNYLLILSCILILSGDLLAQTPCKEIIGYCPNWQYSLRNGIFKPTNIKYSDYTILNYAFFKPETNGKITSTDAASDKNMLEGNSSVVALAHKAGVLVMASIGGWTLSDNFPSIAANATSRVNFAADCNKLLKQYNLDGIDIDWEYPGYDEHMGGAADKKNFTIFMQQIRDSINALGKRLGKQYKLSACFGSTAERASNIEWDKISNILDMLNIMTYDYYGEWDALANHNSPLYAPTSGDPAFAVSSTFTMLTTQFNVSASKINLGIPFYGRSQTGATALFQKTSGQADLKNFPDEEGAPAYWAVMNNMSKFNYYWDNTAKVPYLLGKSGGAAAGTFVSYDNTQSVALKASYILSKGARGVIVWDISHDMMETSPGSGVVAGFPLADTLHKVICGWVTNVGEEKPAEAVELSIYPNPSSDHTTFIVNLLNEEAYTVTVYDILGQELLSKHYDFSKGGNQIVVPVSAWRNGYYFVRIQNKNHSLSKKFIVNH